jgi:hypothetical protein
VTAASLTATIRLALLRNRAHTVSTATSAAWAMASGGHTYVYGLRENDGVTDVTQTYDWPGVTDPKFEALACPFVTREELMATLDRLADAVESPA